MGESYRVGVIGFAHMHVNNVAAQYAEHPQVELVACADTVPQRPEPRKAPYTRAWNMENALAKIGFPKSYEDYGEMLRQEEFDIVICCSENAQHAAVVEACATAGANVCVEKPMAVSLPDARRMVAACREAGTEMIVNWPVTWHPATDKVKELIEQGAIGRVLEVKWRHGHRGPLGPGVAHAGVSESAEPMSGAERGATWWHQVDTGGGAMLDYCSYGALLSRWYIGEQAEAAVCMKANLDSPWGEAEDNAVLLMRFPSAMGLAEGSWTTLDHGHVPGFVVYGTSGTLLAPLRGEPRVRVARGDGEDEVLPCGPLPDGRADVASEFTHHLDTGEPVHPTLGTEMNLEVMAILDAGVRSAASGRMESVPDAAGPAA
jgi:predicted dehydrogenase